MEWYVVGLAKDLQLSHHSKRCYSSSISATRVCFHLLFKYLVHRSLGGGSEERAPLQTGSARQEARGEAAKPALTGASPVSSSSSRPGTNGCKQSVGSRLYLDDSPSSPVCMSVCLYVCMSVCLYDTSQKVLRVFINLYFLYLYDFLRS